MKVDEIIKQVRWCIDEETSGTSYITDDKDDVYMENIIRAKIPDALHWIAITASASSVLSSSSSTQKNASSDVASTTATMTVTSFDGHEDIGVITMPSSVSVFNINRVRGKGWHKAVIPVEDTSDEALMMFDDTSKGTVDRPQAAIMRVKPLQVLVQPMPSDGAISVSYVGVPTNVTNGSGEEDDSVEISDNFRGAFIYYLAFLLLSAYDDSKANQMYSIALQQLGANQTK
jgi:hypothetical protein|nr:hypothetical protein [uncultured Prevotella sp.]